MIDRASQLGCEVFQICDDPMTEGRDPPQLQELRERAEILGLELERGTRTIGREHLDRYLDIAEALGARTLRSMIQSQEIATGAPAALSELRRTLPRLESTGITLALETYEQVRSEEHTSELQSRGHLVCRLLLEKKKKREEHERSRE